MDADAELLAAWETGDDDAGETLYRRRVGEITRFWAAEVREQLGRSEAP